MISPLTDRKEWDPRCHVHAPDFSSSLFLKNLIKEFRIQRHLQKKKKDSIETEADYWWPEVGQGMERCLKGVRSPCGVMDISWNYKQMAVAQHTEFTKCH